MNKLILVALVLGAVALVAAQGNSNKGPGKNPPGWTCDSRDATYNERARRENPGKPVVCDCGCGIWDTDCDVTTKTPQDLDYAFYVDITCPTEDGGRETRDGGVWACSFVEQGCVRVPNTWNCEPNWYNQSLSDAGNTGHDTTASTSNGVLPACHCGCGAADPDCGAIRDVDSNVNTLFCESRNFIALDSVDLVKSDPNKKYCNAPTDGCKTVPEGWTCPAHWYDEYLSGSVAFGVNPTCNCECGVWDPDCEYEAFRFQDATWGLRCGNNTPVFDQRTYCNKNTLTCVDAPEGWNCAGRYYNEAESGSLGPNGVIDCNCGCGVFDPDCNLEGSRNTNGVGSLPLYFGGGDSDDVAPSTDPSEYCDAIDPGTIITAPPGWICPARDYAEFISGNYGPNGKPDCNCNCGIYDPDCDFEYLRTAGDASQLGLFCNPGDAESLNFAQTCSKKTLQCVTADEIFSQYCPAKWWNQYELGNEDSRGKPICDCGCGPVMDPDCNYLSIRFEQGSDVFGLSCDPSGVESNNPLEYCSLAGIGGNNNSQCVTAPSNWNCAPNFYNEVASLSYGLNGKPDCDCGCGTYDADCYQDENRFLIGTHAFGLICDKNTRVEVEDLRTTCEKRVNACDRVPSGWVCPAVWYQEAITQSYVSEPVCHCGCGIFDVDCLVEGSPLACGIESSIVENGLELFECTLDCPFCQRR